MTTKKQLPKGMYELKIKGRKDPLIVQLNAIPIGTVQVPSTPTRETLINDGHNRYFVANTQLGIYTSIGADNIHHASNKCTKLFGPNWSMVREQTNCSELRGYQHCTVAEFKELISTLQI